MLQELQPDGILKPWLSDVGVIGEAADTDAEGNAPSVEYNKTSTPVWLLKVIVFVAGPGAGPDETAVTINEITPSEKLDEIDHPPDKPEVSNEIAYWLLGDMVALEIKVLRFDRLPYLPTNWNCGVVLLVKNVPAE